MAKTIIWLEETKKRINEFLIGYMINPTFTINKEFREQVNKCMKTTFDLFHPKMYPTLSFSGMYQKSYIYHRNRTNYQ